MRKHILLSTEDPGVGGVAQYNHSLLCGLSRLGYRVTYLHPQPLNKQLISDQKQLSIQHLLLDKETIEQLPHTLITPSTRPELIVCSNSNPFSNFTIKQVAIQLRIPYIIVEHLAEPHLAESFAEYLDEISNHYNQAKSVIAVSYENLSLLNKFFRLPKYKGNVIYNGRPSQFFNSRNSSVRERLRQELGISSNTVVCFTAARIEARKGYQYQLKAISQLIDSPVWSQLYFVWAGAAFFDMQLEMQIKEAFQALGVADRVKFLGHISDVSDWLDAADIFVFPSQLEGMPLCVMEAMAKGLPVIATAVSGIPETLGDTGKLLPDPKIEPQATVRELVTAIEDWVMNPDLRDSIGRACQRRAEEMFREERMLEETLKVIEQALLPIGDYVSPGFSIIRPDECFPNMIMGDVKASGWPYLRREIPHNFYVDKRLKGVGFLNRDEAHILYNTAITFKGKRALEIGCWLGWSACHLALAGVGLDVIDPVLAKPEFYESVSNSLRAAGVLDTVNLVSGYSPQKVEELATQFQRKWSLIFIDGNHEAPGPLNDAIICEQFAEADALILFHDLASPDVAQGLEYLKQRGWQTMVYQTMQIMGVAWRGNVEPVKHQPDPKVYWHLPKHLQNYSISGMSNDQSVNDEFAVKQVSEMMQQALTLLNSGQKVEAMRTAEQAASIGITVPGMHYIRSVCLCAVGRNEEGLEAAKAELEINPINPQAKAQFEVLTRTLSKPVLTKISTQQRTWNTTLPPQTLQSIQHASHNYSYKGVPMIKNPFDFALYPLLIWNLKPRTIIEIGSKNGGSALWLGDMLNSFGIEGHVYSVDIVKVTSLHHPRVTFMEGDGRALQETFTPDFFNTLQRPLLVIEDADHAYETSKYVLDFFHQYLIAGEYIVIEDGIISDLTQDASYSSGPHRALKEFLVTHKNEYEADGNYCDFFGYNITWCTNGFLKKLTNLCPSKNFYEISEVLSPTIVFDGVFFQLYQTGIARVWQSLLEEWSANSFAQHIVVIDRAGTAPKIPGIKYRSSSPYNYKDTDSDREMLQQICDEEGADLFISSYYTTPVSTPSVFMAHDMIPELIGWDLNHPMWVEKHYGIRHACAYIAVSENTARDLVKFFPDIPLSSITIAHNGVKATFSPANSDEIHQFKIKYGLSKPYFMLVGAGSGYKNSILFFNAFAQLFSKQGFDILCTGSGGLLEPEFRAYTSGSVIHMLQLSDEELKVAYSGAVALVYPSKYEGFGLPVLEAMACGCPVITCPNGPIPEVAGKAAIYVNDEDVDGMTNALCDVQKPDIRQSLKEVGIQQAQKFSWSKMAGIVSSALIDATLLSLNLKEVNFIIFPDWSQPEESLGIDLERVISAIASHQDKSKMTLLIDTSGISEDDANLTLSGVAMNMLMQENLDISEELEISLLGTLGEIQWEALLPRLTARIILDNENQQAIAKVRVGSLPSWEPAHLSEIYSLL
jgi:glycosyltransferase involved in cell wall biosynthesis